MHECICLQKGEKPSLRISEVDVSLMRLIRDSVQLGLRYCAVKESEDVSCPGYEWPDDIDEEGQKEQYMKYLKDLIVEIDDENDIGVTVAATEDSILDAAHERLPFALRGKADAVFVNL